MRGDSVELIVIQDVVCSGILLQKVAPLTYDEARETECLYESLHVVGADVNHLAEDLVGGGAQLQHFTVHHQLKRARRPRPWRRRSQRGL